MAEQPSGDRPVDHTNGAIEGQQKRTEGELPALGDEQTLADSDQTLADADQTLSDSDQTSSDRDQASADREQYAADLDQAASDRDLGHGVDSHEHEFSRHIRLRAARDREMSAAARLQTADQRDAGAHARDLAALARDQAAGARDLAMSGLDEAFEQDADSRSGTGAPSAVDDRIRAARHRAQAAEQRMLAAEDRQASLADRERAARDRLQALTDRQTLAEQLAIAETDAVTGVRTRLAGLADLDRELDRCRRKGEALVVAFVDVVGLKALNDSRGHAAGDELLQRVVALIRARVRSYDLIVRLGGDEFLCALPDTALAEARGRFTEIADVLAATPAGGSIRAGLAQLEDGESGLELIARADAELTATRGPAEP